MDCTIYIASINALFISFQTLVLVCVCSDVLQYSNTVLLGTFDQTVISPSLQNLGITSLDYLLSKC